MSISNSVGLFKQFSNRICVTAVEAPYDRINPDVGNNSEPTNGRDDFTVPRRVSTVAGEFVYGNLYFAVGNR